MAHYKVKWHHDPTDPRCSHWYELGGIITHTSHMLKKWIGKPHKDLMFQLRAREKTVTQLSNHCVPPTIKYHRELLATTQAALFLLLQKQAEEPKQLDLF